MLIELIRNYPTEGLRLNLPEILDLYGAVNTNIEATEKLSHAVAQRSESAAAAEPAFDYSALPLLAEKGKFSMVQRSLMLKDSQRNRTYPADLYLPENLSAIQGSVPVMVLSHGYGETRTDPDVVMVARKLAANGFVVAVPEHIGSNQTYQDELDKGLRQDDFDQMEFVNRPLDIRFLLDTLEQLNDTEFQGRLQLERVGIMGHSFGGYTALVAAGGNGRC